MNWKYETWRKLYVREEGSFAALSYSARAAAAMLLKLCDDRGKIFSRPKEDIVEAICFRLGTERGERRMLRAAIADLVADGYLERGDGWIRIKNFHRAQGKIDETPESTMSPSGSVPASIERRVSSDTVATELPTGSEPDANAPRPGIEERVKSATSHNCDPALPSVPILPSLPVTDPPHAPAPPARALRTEPDNPANLIHVLGCLVRAAHPEVGLWAPGRFADRDLADFFGHIAEAAGGSRAAAAIIRGKLEAYVAQPSDDGWTVKTLLDRFNELGTTRTGAPARASPRASVTVGHARAEGYSHPTGKQEI